MKYVGSKNRISKYIVPIIQKYIDDNNITTYYEPFAGGANVIDKIQCEKKYASDINPYLIALFQNLNKIKSLPNEISREEYAKVRAAYQKNSGDYPNWYIGAVGFLASYNGKFFGGFAGQVHTKIGTIRNYYDEAKRNLQAQMPRLQGIEWSCKDFVEYKNITNAVIYCDIPYKNLTGYGTKFNYDMFWNWAKKMSEQNIILVSEENAPDDWTTIWEQDIKRTLDNASRSVATEKLFIRKRIENI